MTDEELMRAVCNGEQSAYQTIVKQHLKSISHYAFRILGNQKDTEDITQETFLKLWINAEKWQPEKAKLSTWLHRIAHNLCIDYIRKRGSIQTLENIEEGTDSIESPRDWQDSYEVSETRTQQDRILKNAINILPENQRSALVLCHYSGFSQKEAASIMDISVKALESVITRAKRSLRKQLGDTGNNNGDETTASSGQM